MRSIVHIRYFSMLVGCSLRASAFLFAGSCPAAPALYVHVSGSDANSGTVDRPLASIAEAQKRLRDRKADGELDGPVTVHIGPGTWFLDRTLEFTPEDSGMAAAPITYQGSGAGTTRISGGIPIAGWKKTDGNLWQARIERVLSGKIYFHQLFVNGRRATVAAEPDDGYFWSSGPVDLGQVDASKTKRAFRFVAGDFQEWKNPDDVMVKVYHAYTASLHWIQDIDFDKNIVRFTNESALPMGYFVRSQRYRILNSFEALDTPGEWYLNRKTGILYYWPRPGEDMETAEVIAPVLPELVRFQGNPDESSFVEYLSLKGMSLEYADWTFSRTQSIDGQAHCRPRTAAVKAYGLRHSAIEDCEIAHVGSHAVWLEKGSQDNRIVRCHIHDIGGGGVYIGEAAMGGRMPDETAKVQRNLVDNSFIHDITHVLPGSTGIWVGNCASNTLSHNEISDFDYTGISVGWSWNRDRNIFQQGNIIEYNHVHHTADDVLSDNGGIYVLGWSPGSAIRNNLVHDIYHDPRVNFSRGIYLDGTTSEYQVENNICYRIGSYGMTLKGEYNTVKNNILAYCGKAAFHRGFRHQTSSFDYGRNVILNNIVLQNIPEMTAGYYENRWVDLNSNLYWSVQNGLDLIFQDNTSMILPEVQIDKTMTFAEWQALNRDVNSQVAEPEFADPENGDFSLPSDSQAWVIGYQQTDTAAAAGLYGDPAWKDLPLAYSPRPMVVASPPEAKIDYGFEEDSLENIPYFRGILVTGKNSFIQITNRVAAEGSRSLMFADNGDTPLYQPHLYFSLHPESGPVEFSCDILPDTNLPREIQLLFRNYDLSGEWETGPVITVKADGTVSAAGQSVTGMDEQGWMHLEVQFDQGTESDKTYTLTVRSASGDSRTLRNLPFQDNAFSSCTWFGIISPSSTVGKFYIDNLRLDLKENND
ncbi:MAG: right-handed parallel beta-helix repeat-containing protein [Kiritimatiellales bacterium]